MLTSKEHDENALNEVLRGATDAIPDSVSLWYERIKYLLHLGQENEADTLLLEVRNLTNSYIYYTHNYVDIEIIS